MLMAEGGSPHRFRIQYIELNALFPPRRPRNREQHTHISRTSLASDGPIAVVLRGRERGGPTRSHPEPGRDPAQRRRVLRGRPRGRRGRCGHPRCVRYAVSIQTMTAPSSVNAVILIPRTTRGGAAAARWAHNPKVGGSNPPPATKLNSRRICVGCFFVSLISFRARGKLLLKTS